MTPMVTFALTGLGLVLGLMGLLWVASLVSHDASLVDRFWGLGFVLVAWYCGIGASEGPTGWFTWLVLLQVTVWGVRLSGYIAWRNWGQGEDPRYRAMRERGGSGWPLRSLVTVFGLQGVLVWLLSAPLGAALISTQRPRPATLALGLLCWLVGIVFEAGGDWQLARFKANLANRGRVLDTGLWRWTRHPNYFGDAMCWWGYFLFAASVGGWWTVYSPVLMTLLLMKVSGVALLERSLVNTKPAYQEYIRRTNAFIPGPRRD